VELFREIDQVASMFPRLVERMDQQAGTLSGGEQQMLAIARGLMGRPRLLLVDEPSLGLAPIVVDELYKAMERLRDTGLTILLVEQYVDRALGISDVAYLIEKGRVALQGRSDNFVRDGELARAYLSGGGGP
ncbi:MAG: ATP-binding cassette domain-containing protein, partial [Actinomycetota bacterium]